MPGFNPQRAGDLLRQELTRRSEEYGLQSALARHLDVTSTAVNRWARGNGDPDPELWAAIEEFLDLPPSTLTFAALGINPDGSGCELLAELLERLVSPADGQERLTNKDRSRVVETIEILRRYTKS